jgi:hypothetical protein
MLNKILPTFYCGTAVKITSVFNVDTPTSATVKITNPSTVNVVDNVSMTRETDGVYVYVCQTASNWPEGDYTVTIDVTYAGYQSVTQQKFTLIRQE